jgi:hypothetical protein
VIRLIPEYEPVEKVLFAFSHEFYNTRFGYGRAIADIASILRGTAEGQTPGGRWCRKCLVRVGASGIWAWGRPRNRAQSILDSWSRQCTFNTNVP